MSLNGLFPYLFSLLGLLLALLLILAIGPCIINRLIQFIQQRIEATRVRQVEVHYQRLLATEGYDPLNWGSAPGALHIANDG